MLTDNDFYNFTMGDLIYYYWPRVEVEYELIVRSPIDLRHYVSIYDLQVRFEQIQAEKFTESEIEFLGSLNILSTRYLSYLKNQFRLPEVEISYKDPQLKIKTKGLWINAILWETRILSVINEQLTNAFGLDKAVERLEAKIARLKLNPQIKFMDFGTRRRYSFLWQDSVLRRIKDLSNFIGTSNVWFAKELNIPVRGTIAHQLYMVNAALHLYDDFSDLALSTSIVETNSIWQRQYHKTWDNGLLIALSDTYGSDNFFGLFGAEQFRIWRGFRQDSGDPIEFGNKLLEWYRKYDIDPKDKLLCLSDGLTLDEMLNIYDYFADKIQVSFGWGTNLTNDTGQKPISMVVKPVNCRRNESERWVPCVKLSDNIAKATGNSSVIKHYKEFANYKTNYIKEAVY